MKYQKGESPSVLARALLFHGSKTVPLGHMLSAAVLLLLHLGPAAATPPGAFRHVHSFLMLRLLGSGLFCRSIHTDSGSKLHPEDKIYRDHQRQADVLV